MKNLGVLGVLAALGGVAAAQQPQNAENYKIAQKQMEQEILSKHPAPGPGVEKAPVRAPAWCPSKRPGKYNFEEALDSTRAQLNQLQQYWMDALLGAAIRICDADPKLGITQRTGAFIEQHYINFTGLASKDAVESIRARMNKEAFEAGKTKLCGALTISDEVQGAARKHMAAKQRFFDCGGRDAYDIAGATDGMAGLVPWLDASGTPPDELVRLAFIAHEAELMRGESYREKGIVHYIPDQVDFHGFQPDKVLALLQTEPYKGNPYAQTLVKEGMAGARVNLAAIEEDVKKRGKEAEWKELLVTAPKRGIDAYNAAASKWKAELQRSNEFEDKAYGPSRKALAGCLPALKKDLAAVLKGLKHTTIEELKQSINDDVVAGLLIKRYIVCVAADGDPMVASGFRKHLEPDKMRVVRGPRAAAYYAAIDALSKILEDRAKFPIQGNEIPRDRSDHLDKLAGELLSGKKYDSIGFTDVQKGVVKTAKKGAKGVEISFNPQKRQIYTESCTTTNRIVMFDHDGRPIYYRKCKPTGLQWVDEKPDPVTIAADLADGIAPGKMMVFAVTPYNDPKTRIGMPLEVYADKQGTKLINFFGVGGL